MDVYEESPAPPPHNRPPTPEVSFAAGSDFNLSFFDSPEDDRQPPQPADQQQYLQADSASPSPGNKTFVPCKVCGDKASGYHYGVTSCEGCKGFFRRSIQKQIEYRCLRDGKCLVIRLNRNRCQYCRFKKCLAVGMSRDSVRYGRVPKRSRERGPEEGSSREISVPVVIGEEQCELSRTIATAFRAHCAPVMVDRHPIPCLDQPELMSPDAISTSEGMEAQRIWFWQQLAARMTPTAHRVVEFAKRLPGFSEFTQDDQLILIKMGFFEIWLANAARVATESTITFEDGGYVTVQQLEVMYDASFAAGVMRFISSLNALCLNDTELALFCAAVLVTSERPGITDIKTIQQNQEKIIEAFKLQVSHNHPGGGNVLGCALVTLVSELRGLGNRHAILLDWFRVNWTRIRLPPLFAEIFDIPKCDEDLQ